MAKMLRRTSTMRSLLLFLSILLVSFVSSSSSSSSSPPKVSVGLYYESLCPYCSRFIVNHLVKLFQDEDLFSIVDLHLSPWGNTKLRSDNVTFVCQHGPYECLLDSVEACAIEAWPKLSDHFPFIHCVESLVSEHKYEEWETCFEKLKLKSKPVKDCVESGHGTKLELQYAAETNALQPPHKYVPWVVVNGQPLYEDYENFISYICKAYKGKALPRACAGNSGNALHKLNLKGLNVLSPVCHKGTQIQDVFERVKSELKSWMNSNFITNMAGLV